MCAEAWSTRNGLYERVHILTTALNGLTILSLGIVAAAVECASYPGRLDYHIHRWELKYMLDPVL